MHPESKTPLGSVTMLPLESARLVLRQMQSTDIDAFMAYRNDPQVARFQSWETFSRTAAAHFLEEQETREPLVPGQWLQIAITLKPDQLLIGDCALKIQAEDQRQATIGITLAKHYQGKGFANEALSLLLSFLFEKLRLHRVQADTDPENTPAWLLLERLGFRREAHFRQSLWFKGRWADEYVYAILREEWSSSHRAP